VSFGLELGGFYAFILVSLFSFGCYLLSKGEPNKMNIQGKDKPTKESLRRLQAHRMHQSRLVLRRLPLLGSAQLGWHLVVAQFGFP